MYGKGVVERGNKKKISFIFFSFTNQFKVIKFNCRMRAKKKKKEKKKRKKKKKKEESLSQP